MRSIGVIILLAFTVGCVAQPPIQHSASSHKHVTREKPALRQDMSPGEMSDRLGLSDVLVLESPISRGPDGYSVSYTDREKKHYLAITWAVMGVYVMYYGPDVPEGWTWQWPNESFQD